MVLGGGSKESREVFKDAITALQLVGQISDLLNTLSDYSSVFQFIEVVLDSISFFASKQQPSTSKFTVAVTTQLFSALISFESPLLGIIQLVSAAANGFSDAINQLKSSLPDVLQSLTWVSLSTVKAPSHTRITCSGTKH
jgi:hypothetical protein